MQSKKDIISELKSMRKWRDYMNTVPIPPCTYVRDKLDEKRFELIDSMLDAIAKSSGLYSKYEHAQTMQESKIGTTVWMFWYTGFDAAPNLVHKCANLARYLTESNVILIDKDNLEEYFKFEGRIKELFYEGKISIQTFSDILRCQLLSRHGGFWLDATLFATNKDFITKRKDLSYFSLNTGGRNPEYKKKRNEFFNEGKWCTYCCASAKNNPVFSFIYDMHLAWFERFATNLDYFQTDFFWLYLYKHFSWAREIIDATPVSAEHASYIQGRLLKPFVKQEWDWAMEKNEVQKLSWKKVTTDKLARCKDISNTFYQHFLDFEYPD